MANRLKMAKMHSKRTLRSRDRSRRRIARELGIDRETIGRYVRLAEAQWQTRPIPPARSATDDPLSAIPAGLPPTLPGIAGPAEEATVCGLLPRLEPERFGREVALDMCQAIVEEEDRAHRGRTVQTAAVGGRERVVSGDLPIDAILRGKCGTWHSNPPAADGLRGYACGPTALCRTLALAA